MKPVPLNHGDSSDEVRAADPRPPAGAQNSFDDFYTAQFPFVWRCLRRLGVPAAVLDDAAQDVFLAVHRQLAGFRGESSAQTWLYGITRHVAANHRRSGRRKQAPLEPLVAEPPHPDAGPHERAADAEAAAFVEAFVASLDDRKRDLFILAVLEEMTIPEVAATLSIPVNTAYTRLRAVRAQFERALARHEP
ncbi:MAG TPA: RNA polymerase sigma factor [Polyangia bacterium]|nr:RNA polymerase sigma factor [Polyangia bacterium]